MIKIASCMLAKLYPHKFCAILVIESQAFSVYSVGLHNQCSGLQSHRTTRQSRRCRVEFSGTHSYTKSLRNFTFKQDAHSGASKVASGKPHNPAQLSNPPLLQAVRSAWAVGVYAVECFAAQAVLGDMSGEITLKQDGNYNMWSHFQFSNRSV